MRTLRLILGDQLDRSSPIFQDLDPDFDRLWMAEVPYESTKVWSHRARIALFLSGMRHFAQWIQANIQTPLDYTKLGEKPHWKNFRSALTETIEKNRPQKVMVVEPGEYYVRQTIEQVCAEHQVLLEVLEDTHFLSSVADFVEHAKSRTQLRMEFFYRQMRERYQILMTSEGKPEGGQWNYDHDNRGSFGKTGPPPIALPKQFPPDEITQSVFETIETYFPDHPGSLENFDWPVTSEQAEEALLDFIQNRLPDFGKYQDAMWQSQLSPQSPYLFHARISAALNLKLISPLRVIQAVEKAYHNQQVDLASVEGFIRQVLGWREYVRGIYWLKMPDYLEKNAMAANQPLPAFYWTAQTEMNCLQQTIQQTLDYGYAHHIQRLMVTGLFALLLGVDPKAVHEWYLAVYVDAVEWVELPNTLGMSQYADGGVMASKPYVATGKYIARMSNYCQSCQYNPEKSTGDDACPFTTLYWDYLMRHQQTLQKNTRMGLQIKNLNRLSESDKKAVTEKANKLRQAFASA